MEPRTRTGSAPRRKRLGSHEALEIAVEAYVYGYPLVLMDMTRRQMTNFERATGAPGLGPANRLTHATAFPDPSYRHVARPNVDTLYSVAWMDLGEGPFVLTVPETGERYYVLQFLDYWSDVFASLGTRTTGNDAGRFLVAGPGWSGTVPEGLDLVQAPTRWVLLIGRIQTNGPGDVAAVRRLQQGFDLEPLEGSVQVSAPDPRIDMETPPTLQVEGLSGAAFFERFSELLRDEPPHPNDQPILARMRRIGLSPGLPFRASKAPKVVQEAVEAAPPAALDPIHDHARRVGEAVNGWQYMRTGVGTYGTDYLQRAAVVYVAGTGANTPEDAVYPFGFTDTEGEPLHGRHRYVLHFSPERIPPVNAFWSVTVYDADQALSANPLDRYALGDRDPLEYGEDGSLDLFIQHERPASEAQSNWLPVPKGPFSLNLRLYWPKAEVLDGRWRPPGLRRSD